MRLTVEELSVVFLCYDEPKRESFFQHLKNQIGSRAVKVEGVKGWDNAHKAAAAAATTERFVLVDGDATVYPEFWNLDFRLPEKYQNSVLSFCAFNVVNALCYGYGGLKIWTRTFIRNMHTHENSNEAATKFEFCYLPGYEHFASVWNQTHIAQSEEQAFRAGFREAIKILSPYCVLTPFNQLEYAAQRKLVQWCTLGKDAANGEWVLAGARLAVHLAQAGNLEVIEWVNSYDKLDGLRETYGIEGLVMPLENIPAAFDKEQSEAIKKWIRATRKQYHAIPLEPCAYTTE